MSNGKNPIVILLLIQGFVFNFIILPLAILFPDLSSELFVAKQFDFQDWVNSVCINVLAWHLFYTALKNKLFFKTPRRLTDELKK